MSFIAKNPISAAEITSIPSTPIKGVRGLFAKKDGWYDIDDYGNVKKIGGDSTSQEDRDKLNRLQYYGDANIIPSDASLFEFVVNDTTMTASVKAKGTNISGSIVIPYEFVINDNVYKINRILDNAFAGCVGITNITIPDSVVTLGLSSFGTTSIANIEIPDGCSSIPKNCFSSCLELTEIKIPKSVTNIENSAFTQCENLTDVYYEGTKADWTAITIVSLNNATIHYEYVPTTKGYVDEQVAEVKPKIGIQGDEEFFIEILSNNRIISLGVVNGYLSIGFMNVQIGYTSALYFSTPAEVPDDYSAFPEDTIFKGDSVEDERFVPEANMRYTIVFDYDGVNMIGYVSGVSLE